MDPFYQPVLFNILWCECQLFKIVSGGDLMKDFIVNYNNNTPFSYSEKKSFCEVNDFNEAVIIKQLLLF